MAMKSNVDERSVDEDADDKPLPTLMKKGTSEYESNADGFIDEKIGKLRESKLARKFSDRITQSVIIMILGMLFA